VVGELPCDGVRVPGMVSAAEDGLVVSVCGYWAACVTFPGLNGLLTSLAPSGAPAGRDGGERDSRAGYLAGADVPVSIVDVTSTGDSVPGGVVWDLGLRYGAARQQYL